MFYSFELEKYLEQLLRERDHLLQEMEELALQQTIPVVTPAVGNFLAWLVHTAKAARILEIGTAIGYSTLWLARAAEKHNGHVITIDMNLARRQEALNYFARAGQTGRITSLAGDARKILPGLEGPFDLVFIDAAKGEYLEYFDLVQNLIKPGGLLVVDNVLFRGWVVPGAKFEPKYQRMVNSLREFLHELHNHPEFSTTVLPLGDGLSLSMKKE